MKLEKPHALSLKEYTAHTLRQAILRGELRPGTRIVEQVIAEEMGISRGPVREAINQLASEGLMVIYPRRGAEVRKLKPRDAWEVNSLRGALEAFALRQGYHRLTPSGVEHLQCLVHRMAEACDELDLPAVVDLDLAFHGHLVELANHARLSAAYHALDPMLGAIFYMFVHDLDLSVWEMASAHQVIVDALQSGDLHLSVTVLTAHYQKSADRLLQLSHVTEYPPN